MNPDSPILTKIVHEESTNEGVANFMSIPKDGSNTLMALVDNFVHFYTIEKQSGKLELLHKFQADFAQENPSLNHAVISSNNSFLATGGDDHVARVFQLAPGFKGSELKLKVEHSQAPISSLDISRDN